VPQANKMRLGGLLLAVFLDYSEISDSKSTFSPTWQFHSLLLFPLETQKKGKVNIKKETK